MSDPTRETAAMPQSAALTPSSAPQDRYFCPGCPKGFDPIYRLHECVGWPTKKASAPSQPGKYRTPSAIARTAGSGKLTYPCYDCGQGFARRDTLEKHRTNMHKPKEHNTKAEVHSASPPVPDASGSGSSEKASASPQAGRSRMPQAPGRPSTSDVGSRHQVARSQVTAPLTFCCLLPFLAHFSLIHTFI